MIHCSACQYAYPEDSIPYCCPACGGVFDFSTLPSFDPDRIADDQPGIWRYRHTFGLPSEAPMVRLGEGDTPLVWSRFFGQDVALKLESLNPTGSFKDRGTALLISFLRGRGVDEAVEDSSGNAGASFSAYAARAGIQGRVYVPDYASGPKRAQIAAYGAEVIAVPGPRSRAAEAVREAARQGAIYASHAYLPQGIPGFSTVAYELYEQLGQVPGTVIVPAGQGTLLLGIERGFKLLKEANLISKEPVLVGVQAQACAPMAALFQYGPSGLDQVSEGETRAEGVRIIHPHRGAVIVELVKSTKGKFITVDEQKINLGRDAMACQGFYIEPTSAIVWDALAQVVDQVPKPIVVVLTGSGLKSHQ